MREIVSVSYFISLAMLFSRNVSLGQNVGILGSVSPTQLITLLTLGLCVAITALRSKVSDKYIRSSSIWIMLITIYCIADSFSAVLHDPARSAQKERYGTLVATAFRCARKFNRKLPKLKNKW